MPSIDQVRMVNSGTEATIGATGVRRGFTGRNRIMKFAGCYHGHVDSLLVKAGSGALTHGNAVLSRRAGTAAPPIRWCLNSTINRRSSRFSTNHGKDIACVIIEPVVGNMGVVAPQTGFLKAPFRNGAGRAARF